MTSNRCCAGCTRPARPSRQRIGPSTSTPRSISTCPIRRCGKPTVPSAACCASSPRPPSGCVSNAARRSSWNWARPCRPWPIPGNRSHRPAPARRGAGRVADILRRGQRRRHDLPGSSRLSPRRPLGGRSASPVVRRHPVRRTACRTQRGAGRPRRGARHESRRGGEPRAPGAGRHAARPGAAPRPAGGAAGDPLRPSAGARRRSAPPGGGSRQAGLDLAHPCPRGAGAAHQFRATGGDVRPGQRGHRGMRPELALHPGQRSLLRDRRPFARDPTRPAHAGHPRPADFALPRRQAERPARRSR